MPRSDKEIIAEILDKSPLSWGGSGGNGISIGGAVLRFDGMDRLIDVDTESEEPEPETCSECNEIEETMEKMRELAKRIVDL